MRKIATRIYIYYTLHDYFLNYLNYVHTNIYIY